MALVMSWMPAASTSFTCATDTAPPACDASNAGKGLASLGLSSRGLRASSCAVASCAAGGSFSNRAAGEPASTCKSSASASATSLRRARSVASLTASTDKASGRAYAAAIWASWASSASGSVTTNALAISLAARAAQRRRSTPCSGERIMGDPIGLRMQRCRLSGSPQTRATPTPRSSKPRPSTCSDADSSPPSTCPEATRLRTWRASSGK